MPQVSVIIPTHNRPELVGRAIASVLNQTFQDFEIIVIDDGLEKRAESVVLGMNDQRIKYLKNDRSLGGGGTRNVGIKAAEGEYIAFLDDDDEWLSNKLSVQMAEFLKVDSTVGFCFSGVINVYANREDITKVIPGVRDYSEIALSRFKGFLTVTLIIKREVLEEMGFFDEDLPSHQEADLILRISQKYLGLGIDKPLVRVRMTGGQDQVGGNIHRRIAGRIKILEKHRDKYVEKSVILARHYFWLGLQYRKARDWGSSAMWYRKSLGLDYSPRVFFHYLLSKARKLTQP